ncbi:MAG: hypothetical protein H7A53_11395 [Akkermansiaceae bacterium]|nr:hypothetical protein [Akkermansiaceae bacterium]MCP5551484.1 hypothetical protein [Akkermansiaceae bacterium]
MPKSAKRQNRRRPRLRRAAGRAAGRLWLGWDPYLLLGCYALVFGLLGAAHILLPSAKAAADGARAWLAPNVSHWFGLDAAGNDLLMRSLRAGAVSLWMALLATLAGGAAGLAAAAAVALGGRDRGYRLLAKLCDLPALAPGLILLFILSAGAGQGFWISVALLAPFVAVFAAGRAAAWFFDWEIAGDVLAARTLGYSRARLVWEHYVPRLWPRVTALAAGILPAVLLAQAGLSFSGFGAGAEAPDLGRVVAEGRAHLFEAPWVAFCPGLMLWTFTLMLAMLGWAVRRTAGEPVVERVF